MRDPRATLQVSEMKAQDWGPFALVLVYPARQVWHMRLMTGELQALERNMLF